MPAQAEYCSLSNEARDVLLEIEDSWCAGEYQLQACMFCIRMRGAEKFWNCSGERSGPDAGPICDEDLEYWWLLTPRKGLRT